MCQSLSFDDMVLSRALAPNAPRATTHLGNGAARIRLLQPLSQRGRVQLQPPALVLYDFEIPQHPVPHALPLPDIAARIRALQADQVKVPYDPGPQRKKHLVLQVVVILVQALLRPAGGPDGRGIGGGVVVDRDAVHVVHRADEVVHAGRQGEFPDQRRERGPDEFGLEADEDVDLLGVLCLQALRLDEVGLVPGGKSPKGFPGTISL